MPICGVPPHPSLLRRTYQYASLLRISGALHLGIFDQPAEDHFLKKNVKREEVMVEFPFQGPMVCEYITPGGIL
jgi:hypothetical protein